MSNLNLRLIGCSDYPAALSLDEPGPVGLFARCAYGVSTPRPPELEEQGELGKAFEAPVAAAALRKLGRDPVRAIKPDSIEHPGGREWARYSLDPVIATGPQAIGTEIKCRLPWVAQREGWGEEGTEEIPLDVYAQVQGQMESLRADRDRWVGTVLPELEVWHVVLQRWVTAPPTIYPIRYAPEAAAEQREIMERLWTDHIVPRVPPPMDGFAGARDFLRRAYPRAGKTVREAQPHEVEALKELLDVRAKAKALEEIQSGLEAELMEYVGVDLGFDAPDGLRARWYQRSGRTDHAKVMEEIIRRHPVLREEIDALEEQHRGEPYRYLDVQQRAPAKRRLKGGGAR